MLYKYTVVFFAAMVGLAAAEAPQPDREAMTKKNFPKTFSDVASEADKQSGAAASVKNLLPYAAQLAGKDAQVDVAFLQQIVKVGKPTTRVVLAALVLGGRGSKEAGDCLSTLLMNNPRIGSQVALYMSVNNLRGAAERILATKKEAKLQIAAARWLGLVGDKNSLVMLKKLSAGVAEGPVRTELQRAISMVTKRLNDAPKGRDLQWAMQQLRYFRAWKDAAGSHTRKIAVIRAARSLAREETFSVPFLRNAIRSGDLLSVVIAGKQRETALVDDLAKRTPSTDWEVGMLIDSLANIGNVAAMDAIAGWIKPGAIEANKMIADILARANTESAATLLEKLSEDTKYKASWPIFKESLKRQRSRFKKPESRPDTRPASQAFVLTPIRVCV